MCGIVGYVGPRQAQDILLPSLSRLEYRGYDSAGIAVMDGGEVHLCKTKGRLVQLEESIASSSLPGSTGIGHTRWATHGEPSDINAHPHMSMDKRITVVHNGIIENHATLRAMLQAKGYVFISETDTEVIAHLLQDLYTGNMIDTLRKAQDILEGSYALAVLCTMEPDDIFCTKKDSPLILGLGQGEAFIASDIPAVLPYTRNFDFLNDLEIVAITHDQVHIFDPHGHERPVNLYHVSWNVEDAEKGGFDHFMLKEIHEEPAALKRTLSAYIDMDTMQFRDTHFSVSEDSAQALSKITIVACGTAYHAGLLGKYIIEKLAHIPVTVDIASEFRYRDPLMDETELCIAISQSGETADTLAAFRHALRHGAQVMAITNVVGSTLSREAGLNVLYTHAGPEIAVASTKAFITQVEMLVLLSVELAVKRKHITALESQIILQELSVIPTKAEALLTSTPVIQCFAKNHHNYRHVFFIGRCFDSALAMEASLKLKEVSYIISEAYPAGELKHGTIALIEKGTLVCALITQSNLADKTLSNVREVRARGAQTLIICTDSLRDKATPEADEIWTIPDCSDMLTPLLAIIPLQLLAYYMAVSRGCDVDKPRNLAKSVTVE